MARVPSAIWVVDTKKEHIAVNEARKLGIPVVAILDTNCDPDEVNYPIPGNDDAIRSVALLTRVVADAVAEGLIAQAGASSADEKQPAARSAPRSRSPSGSASSSKAPQPQRKPQTETPEQTSSRARSFRLTRRSWPRPRSRGPTTWLSTPNRQRAATPTPRPTRPTTSRAWPKPPTRPRATPRPPKRADEAASSQPTRPPQQPPSRGHRRERGESPGDRSRRETAGDGNE